MSINLTDHKTSPRAHLHMFKALLGLLLVIPPVAFAETFPASLATIEIKGPGSMKSSAIAVAVASDTLVTSCAAISEAVSIDAVIENRRVPVMLTASLPLENLCRLGGKVGGDRQPISARATAKVGSTVNVYMLDDQHGHSWKTASATIKRKGDGGTNRVLYIDASAISTQVGTPLTAAVAFDDAGKLVGLVSPLPGVADLAGIVMLDDLDRAGWFAVSTEPGSRTKAKQVSPSAQLSSGRNHLGATLSYVDLGESYQRVGNYSKMLALAEQWKVEDERNPAAHTLAAIALLQLKFVDKATTEVEKAMAIAPDYLGAKIVNIVIKERQRRGTEAEILETKALAVEARDNLDEYERVVLLMRLKRNDEALVLAQRLLTEEPMAPYAQAAFCQAGMGSGERAKATEICKEYVEGKPDAIAGWLRLSYAYFSQGRLDDSLAAARKIIEINPEFPEGWLALGIVAEAKGEKQRVSEAEQRIKELDPTILERFNKQRSAQGCYRDNRDKIYASAIDSCKEAARLDDQNAGVQAALGIALFREKRLDEAIAAYESAVRLNPKMKGAWSDLTYAYAQKHDAGNTRTALEHLRSLDSAAADAIYPKVRNVLN